MRRSAWRPRAIGFVLLSALARPAAGLAQNVDALFPPIVPGFDQQAGVTVLSRLRPLYQEQGIRLGSFVLNGAWDEKLGYDSNITGASHPVGSALVRTTGTASAISDWSRDRLGVALGVDDYNYLSASRQNYTNFNAGLGGGYTLGEHDLNVGYSHLRLHELGTDIGAVATATPITYDVDAVRADYTVDRGRFTFVPNVEFQHFDFGSANVLGQQVSQSYRDRTVLTGGVTTRFALSEQRSLLLVLQGSSSHYLDPQPGPTNNSKTVLALAGLDYQATGPFRYRLLVGAELREFESARYGTRAGPIAEASVIWTPTGLTTVTGSVRRAIEEPQTELTSGYTASTFRVTVDHELQRNVLLQGRGVFQAIEYLQGNQSTTSYSVGGGANWLVNRRLRLSADYDFTQQSGSTNPTGANLLLPNTLTTGNYNRNVFLVGFHLAL